MKFDESIDSQEEWCQYHHLCFWELMWCHRSVARTAMHDGYIVVMHDGYIRCNA